MVEHSTIPLSLTSMYSIHNVSSLPATTIRSVVIEEMLHMATAANVLNAVDWANRHGLMTFGLTGYEGGRLKDMQQDGLHVALDDMGMVESIHLCLFHWVLNDSFARINCEGRYAG